MVHLRQCLTYVLLVGVEPLPLNAMIQPPAWENPRDDVDWLAATIATACLAILANFLV